MLKIVPIKDTNVLLDVVASTYIQLEYFASILSICVFACCPVALTYKTVNLLYTIMHTLRCCFLWRFKFWCAILKNR